MAVPFDTHNRLNSEKDDALSPQIDPVIANQRSNIHFVQAQRHSTLVTLLKKTLPVIALILIVGFTALGILNTRSIGNIAVESTGISNGMLVMESPKMSGFNRDNRPYDLSASRARQELTNPNVIKMENLRATVPMQADVYADIKAVIGTYNSDKEWLTLDQNIEINSEDGTNILLDSAEIDLARGRLVSNNPVTVSTPGSSISADKVEVMDNGSVIIFTQRVKMTIHPEQSKRQDSVNSESNNANNQTAE